MNASGNPVKSVAHTLSGVASIVRSIPKRVDYDEVDIPDLAALAELSATVEQAIADTVRRLRESVDQNGERWVSWAAVGQALGMTRQAAQQRFGGRP